MALKFYGVEFFSEVFIFVINLVHECGSLLLEELLRYLKVISKLFAFFVFPCNHIHVSFCVKLLYDVYLKL